jgi:hypothetical protein
MKFFLKFIISVVIGIIILFGCTYFFITSHYFLQKFLLPEISKIVKGDITAENISYSSIFNDINIKNAHITFPGKFDLKAKNIDAEFNIWQLLWKTIDLKHITISDSNITIIQQYNKYKKFGEKPIVYEHDISITNIDNNLQENKKSSYKININNIRINNLNIKYIIKHRIDNKTSHISLNNFYLYIPHIKTNNNSTGKFTGELNICDRSDNNKQSAKINGKILLNLSNSNTPSLCTINTELKFNKKLNSKLMLKITCSNLEQKPVKSRLVFTAKELPLSSIYKIFIDGSYNKTDSMIKKINLNLENNNLTTDNMMRNIEGHLQASLVNLSLPSELQEYDIVKAIFLPLNIIASINDYDNTQKDLPLYFKKVSMSADRVISGTTTLNFRSADIDLTLKNNTLHLNKTDFKDGVRSPIENLYITGTIDNNKYISLKTNTTIAKVQIPLIIWGTMEKPNPIISTFKSDLLSKNKNLGNNDKKLKSE